MHLLFLIAACTTSTPPAVTPTPVPPEPVASACPAPRESSDMCIQMVVYAKDPASGDCCMYGNPCVAPEGWETFPEESACQAAP